VYRRSDGTRAALNGQRVEDQGVGGKRGSEWIWERWLGGCGLDLTGSGQGPVAGYCECGDEPLGSCATELVSFTNKSKPVDQPFDMHDVVRVLWKWRYPLLNSFIHRRLQSRMASHFGVSWSHTYRHTVGLLWTSDQPVAEASTYTRQHNRQTSIPRAGSASKCQYKISQVLCVCNTVTLFPAFVHAIAHIQHSTNCTTEICENTPIVGKCIKITLCLNLL
jgi:hypothetical protein